MKELEKSIKDHDANIEANAITLEDVDYKNAEKHLPFFKMLESTTTTIVVVMDYCKHDYFYYSERFDKAFGFKNRIELKDHNWFRRRFHPDDYIINIAGVKAREFIATQSVKTREDYKFTFEFRILNDENQYVRLIIQDFILEMDKKGAIWLNMKLVDLSPIQDLNAPATAVFSNKRTREVIFTMVGDKNLSDLISNREKQILQMVAGGMRSKEIADQLFISANTVNNHRKNLMDKLKVSNSTEAVTQGIKMGII